jgi:hypothetical protein
LQQARKQFLAAAMEQNRQNKPLAAASTHTELSKRAEQSCLQQLEHTHIREKRAEQLEQNRYSHQKKKRAEQRLHAAGQRPGAAANEFRQQQDVEAQ